MKQYKAEYIKAQAEDKFDREREKMINDIASENIDRDYIERVYDYLIDFEVEHMNRYQMLRDICYNRVSVEELEFLEFILENDLKSATRGNISIIQIGDSAKIDGENNEATLSAEVVLGIKENISDNPFDDHQYAGGVNIAENIHYGTSQVSSDKEQIQKVKEAIDKSSVPKMVYNG